MVDEHLRNNPASPEELEKAIKGAAVPITVESLKNNTFVWYGATLLGTVVTDSFIIYLQIGDGEILSVSEEGEVRRPIPPDERLLGNDTTSLCSAKPWLDFRIVFQALTTAPPSLVLLSTDGYINSFTDTGEFMKVGPDFLNLINAHGLEAVDGKLEDWLTEASQKGSGDDITLGIISRIMIHQKQGTGPDVAPPTDLP